MAKKLTKTSSVLISVLAYIPAVYFTAYTVVTGRDAVKWVAVSCIFLYLGALALYDPAWKFSEGVMKYTFVLYFALYIVMIVNFTLFAGYFGRAVDLGSVNLESVKSYAAEHTNFVPFQTVTEYYRGYRNGNVNPLIAATNILGNVFAFVPFAFFMPLLLSSMKKFWNFFIFIGVFVIIIELLQLVLMTGAFDIDDFLLNVTGATVFYGIFKTPPLKKLIYTVTKQRI